MATDKFKAMVHVIVASCHDPYKLGATRLNKICWYSDSSAFRALGAAITGEVYVKRPKGPVPYNILKAMRSLEEEGKIAVKESVHPVYKTRLFYSLEEPRTDMFSGVESSIIHDVARAICENHTANSISELSHDQIWAAATDGEQIPMFATLVADAGEVTPEVAEWADSVLKAASLNQQGDNSRVAG